MSGPIRYQYFKYIRSRPELVIGALIVRILESVLLDFVQNIHSPSTDDAIVRILPQDDQPKLKDLLWIGLNLSVTYSTQKTSGALIGGRHLGKLLSLKIQTGSMWIFLFGHIRLIGKAAQRIPDISNARVDSGLVFANHSEADRPNKETKNKMGPRWMESFPSRWSNETNRGPRSIPAPRLLFDEHLSQSDYRPTRRANGGTSKR
jgi:hypothetical protein